ncbi:MAG TPA: flap endonuclease-1 [Candidatus Altiarchaeales archaeon]|nr:MAG: flap endonuclease-1 [Candidatus Altiarchaeales archaeon]HDN83468.1 flap endonuclease-1 [Candidatus Altiarchaeales archaeon]
MGVNLKDLVKLKPISLEDLKDKTIAIDALNSIYQFLSSIRQADGTPLMDSKGRITSHLSGLFYRTIRLLEARIKPIYVFDGEPPKLKVRELERRKKLKEEEAKAWKKALEEMDLEEAKKHAKRTSHLTDEMIDDSKKLLEYMGIPYVQAPSEGEAQASYLCKKGDAWAVGSQDYDSLLFGAERIVRGLTISGKLELQLVTLKEVLESLGITREQLVDLAILVGTDFNEGVKGIGPKKALKIVKENRISQLKLDFDIESIREIFLKPKITKEYTINWKKPNKDKIIEFLCEEHDFSRERVEKAANKLSQYFSELSQPTLSKWF